VGDHWRIPAVVCFCYFFAALLSRKAASWVVLAGGLFVGVGAGVGLVKGRQGWRRIRVFEKREGGLQWP
jgi:hypothetical protein